MVVARLGRWPQLARPPTPSPMARPGVRASGRPAAPRTLAGGWWRRSGRVRELGALRPLPAKRGHDACRCRRHVPMYARPAALLWTWWVLACELELRAGSRGARGRPGSWDRSQAVRRPSDRALPERLRRPSESIFHPEKMYRCVMCMLGKMRDGLIRDGMSSEGGAMLINASPSSWRSRFRAPRRKEEGSQIRVPSRQHVAARWQPFPRRSLPPRLRERQSPPSSPSSTSPALGYLPVPASSRRRRPSRARR